MINNISSLLLTIAGVSASFVAILGGCIATKLLSINQERENYRNKLSEIRYKKFLFTEQRNMSKRLMDEADALHYINQYLDAFMQDFELEDIYDENEKYCKGIVFMNFRIREEFMGVNVIQRAGYNTESGTVKLR